MLEIKQFEPKDILIISPREPDRSILNLMQDPLSAAHVFAASGPAITGWIGAVPAFCMGFGILWPHVAEGWALTSSLVPENPVSFQRATKTFVDQTIKQFDLHRAQLSIPVSHHTSRRWAQRLGFVEEGLMSRYGPDGSDYVRAARIS